MFCKRGAMRKYLEGDRRVPLKPYAQNEELKESFVKRWQRDGFAAPLCWYHSRRENVHFEDEKHLTPEDMHVSVPMLFIGSTGDAVCMPAMNDIPKAKGLLPDLTVHVPGLQSLDPSRRT